MTYGYDALRRVTSISVGGLVQQEFKHDSTGRQISSRDYNRLVGEDPIVVEAAKVFDSLGRVVEESQTVGAGDAEFVTTSFTGEHGNVRLFPDDKKGDQRQERLWRVQDLHRSVGRGYSSPWSSLHLSLALGRQRRTGPRA